MAEKRRVKDENTDHGMMREAGAYRMMKEKVKKGKFERGKWMPLFYTGKVSFR